MEIEEKNVLVNGLRVNYKTIGKGKIFLILHGWSSSSESWTKAIKELSSHQGYEIICPDFPGFGKSNNPPNAWSVGDYKDWVISFIDKLAINNIILLGHSFGGRVAIKMAVEDSERIDSLILCASAGIRPRPGIRYFLIRVLAESGNCILSIKFPEILKALAKNIFYLFLRRSDYVKAKGVMRESLKKIVAEDLKPYLFKIKLKTLLVWGQDDKLVPLKYARIFKKSIENSELKIIDGVGHGPNLEAPEKLSEIIFKFLQPET